jgi:hypothetical protein
MPWDFNGDGRADVASGSGNGEVIVANGTKHGLGLQGRRFTVTTKGMPATSGGQSWFGTSLGSADFDRDGYADLAVTDPLRSTVFVLYGARHGLTTAGSRAFTAAASNSYYARTVHVGDLNADGWPDLMVQTGLPDAPDNEAAQYAVTVLWGSSLGFSDGDSYQIPSPDPTRSNFGSGLVARDLDGDGYPDLVVTSPGTAGSDDGAAGGTWVCTGAVTGPQTCTTLGNQADAVAMGNVVGGKRIDVVTADAGAVTVYRNTGHGLAQGKLTVGAPDVHGHPFEGDSLDIAPLHRGNRSDVVLGNFWPHHTSGEVAILRGRRAGLRPHGELIIDQSSNGVPGKRNSNGSNQGNLFGASVSAVDVTGDGRADLLVGAPGAPHYPKDTQGAVYFFHGKKHHLASRASRTLRDDLGVGPHLPSAHFGGLVD